MILKAYLNPLDIQVITRLIREQVPLIRSDQLDIIERELSTLEIEPWYGSAQISPRIIDVSTCPECGASEQMTHILETFPAIEVWECSNGHRREIRQSR
jgi:uncharacterized protein (DUF2225 family)